MHLPGLPHKGDVSDWIAAGGTVEKLAPLCDAPPEKLEDRGQQSHHADGGAADDNWQHLCICNPETKKPLPILHNALIALSALMPDFFALDEMARAVVLMKPMR